MPYTVETDKIGDKTLDFLLGYVSVMPPVDGYWSIVDMGPRSNFLGIVGLVEDVGLLETLNKNLSKRAYQRAVERARVCAQVADCEYVDETGGPIEFDIKMLSSA